MWVGKGSSFGEKKNALGNHSFSFISPFLPFSNFPLLALISFFFFFFLTSLFFFFLFSSLSLSLSLSPGYANEYLIKNGRPAYLPISKIVDGGENELFEMCFKVRESQERERKGQ